MVSAVAPSALLRFCASITESGTRLSNTRPNESTHWDQDSILSMPSSGKTCPGGPQSSLLSEKALFRIDIQLKITTDTQPISPAKNRPSSKYLLQSITLRFI